MATYKEKLRSITGLNLAASGNNGQDAVDAIIITPVANSAAANICTITNAALGQASTLTIPDPGTATAKVALAPTALVNGNLVAATAAGLLVDSAVSTTSVSSAITQLSNLSAVSVTLSASQMAAAYATPAVLIAAPVAGKFIRIISATVSTNSTGQTALATGTAPIIQYGTTAHGAGTIATAAGLVAGDIIAATSQARTLFPAATAANTGLSGLSITFSNATGAYTAGTGTTVTFDIIYQVCVSNN